MQDQDGIWCTPPLDEQVLPGVTRREVVDLLDDQQTPVAIRRCSVQDLLESRGAFWTSSLSGAVPITAVDGTALPDVSEFTAELNKRLGQLEDLACGERCSAAPLVAFQLALRMQSPDPSIYLWALITIDPAGWDPFGQPVSVDAAAPAFL